MHLLCIQGPAPATQFLGLVIPEPQSPSWTVELELTTIGPIPVKVKFTVKPHKETTLLERLLSWGLYPQDDGSYTVHNPTIVMSPSGTLHPVVLAMPPPKMVLRSRWYVIYIFVVVMYIYIYACTVVSMFRGEGCAKHVFQVQ